MDIDKLCRNVKSLNDYTRVTESITRMIKNQPIHLNMSTVCSLKKLRSLEVEYFNNRNENGAAFLIIEQMLALPPAKTWGLLGKELISLLKYWLDATRKQITIHYPYWWLFLEFLLKFMKGIWSKDPDLPDILVEGTAERLLDLATKPQPDVFQRQAILQCMNLCCAGSSRKIRFALRPHLEHYFVKLSCILATSGDFPIQHSILETLVHWLLPRQNLAVRQAAAAKWFPNNLYRINTVDIFLQRQWKNFYQDARDFLNSHNKENDTIISANCRGITIGDIVAYSSLQDRSVWVDVNSSSKSISILMRPQMLQAIGVNDITSFRYMVITEDNVQTAQLCRLPIGAKIVVKTLNDLTICPSANSVGASEVCVEVSSRTDLRRLDNALRNILDDKYQGLEDFANVPPLLPATISTTVRETPDEDTKLSHPVQVTRRKRSGYMVRSKATHLKSPSSTSTTSLALLRDRLAAHSINFDKTPVKVSLLPRLSNVSEVTEVSERQNFGSCSTKILRPYGVCCKQTVNPEKKQQDDGKDRIYTSPVPNKYPTSCLLVATIGSDESVINDTLERLSKSKDYTKHNVVDLLIQEAFQSKEFQSKENLSSDSGITNGDNRKTQGKNVGSENIHNLGDHSSSEFKNKFQNITSDHSNEIKETPYEFVNVRKRNLIKRHNEKEEPDNSICENKLVYKNETLEQFFSQHIAEDKQNIIKVSPTLARKINDTSSDSDELNNCLNKDYDDNIHHDDVIYCLNDIVDKVCADFDKCAKIIDRDNYDSHIMDTLNKRCTENVFNVPDIENVNTFEKPNEIPPKKRLTKQNRKTKLKFNTNNYKLNKNRFKASAKPISPIPESKNSVEPHIKVIEPITVELKDESIPGRRDCVVVIETLKETPVPKSKKNCEEIDNMTFSPKSVNLDSALVRRKRKENIHISDENDNNTVPKTMKKIVEIVSPKNKPPDISVVNVSPESNNSDTPLLVRKKRKLYSPKDEIIGKENEQDNNSAIENDNKAKTKINTVRSPKFTATSYKEIEKERTKNIRQRRIRTTRSKLKAQPLSPRSKKMNDVFDTLKENVETDQNIVLTGRKSIEQELAIYNFTSDSEDDEDFKIKKMEAKKRISARLTNDDLMISTRQIKQINSSSLKEKIPDKVIKKPLKQLKMSRSQKRPTQRKPYTLVDERMREAPPEELNSSIILEKSNTVNKELDLVLEVRPQMELITVEEYDKHENPAAPQKITKNKKGKTETALLFKKIDKHKSKINPNEQKIDTDDRTISPLPELVVENEVAFKNDLNDSLSSQMIVKKLKETYKVAPDCVDEPNTAQNILDVNNVDISSQNTNVTNILSEICQDKINENTNTFKMKTKNVKAKRNSKIFKELDNGDIETVKEIAHKEPKTKKKNKNSIIINISTDSAGKSQKSINTIGKSPITAHGDINEAPPNFELLDEPVTPRNLELENLDPSLKDYFLKLRDDINCLPITSRQSNIDSKQSCIVLEEVKLAKSKDIIKSPTVSIQKLSHDDIHRWIPSVKNSESVSSSSEKDFKPITIKILRSHEISNFEGRAQKTNKKGKYNDKDKSNARSHNNFNETSKTGKKKICEQKRLKNNASEALNKAKNKPEDNNISRTISKKQKSNYITEKDSDLALNTSHAPNLDSNKFDKNCKENAFESKTGTISRTGYDSVPSMISSIKLDDLKSVNSPHNEEKIGNNSETTHNSKIKKSQVISTKAKEETYKSKTLRPTNEPDDSEISSIRSGDNDSLNIPYIENTYDTGVQAKVGSKVIKRNNRKRSLSISSNRSKLSLIKDNNKTSVKNVFKRQSESPASDYGKKKKSESFLPASDPSVSSVNEWFRRNTPLSLEKNLEQLYTDALQNIMERLNTTLKEIHQNTNMRFAHLFVKTQSQLAEHKTLKLNMYKQAANDIKSGIATMTAIMEDKFADLEMRSQQMDNEFMELLKRQSYELMKEDNMQKQAMVVLLEQDLQAVADHLAEKRSGGSGMKK